MNANFKGLGKWVLPLSWLYAIGLMVHRGLYQIGLLPVHRLPVPVISVGNVVAGGSGKTPLTIWLARQLQGRGFKCAICLRGYKADNGQSDEALMIQQLLPNIDVIVGKNRYEQILSYLSKHHVDVIIADDALQHWPLAREINILVLNAQDPIGNGLLLPAGVLREDLPSALARTNMVVITKLNNARTQLPLIERLLQDFQGVVALSDYEPLGLIDSQGQTHELAQEEVLLVSGVGYPSYVTETLSRLFVRIKDHLMLEDHAVMNHQRLTQIINRAQELNVRHIVVTQKDMVKIQPLLTGQEPIMFLSLPIKLVMTKGEDAFIHRLLDGIRLNTR